MSDQYTSSDLTLYFSYSDLVIILYSEFNLENVYYFNRAFSGYRVSYGRLTFTDSRFPRLALIGSEFQSNRWLKSSVRSILLAIFERPCCERLQARGAAAVKRASPSQRCKLFQISRPEMGTRLQVSRLQDTTARVVKASTHAMPVFPGGTY